VRHVRPLRERAGAHEGDLDPVGTRPDSAQLRRSRLRLLSFRVAEQDEQRPVVAALERRIRSRSVVNIVTLLRQAVEPYAAGGSEPEVLLHVPVLRPAHVADRVVLSLQLVDLVVASRSVRGRHQYVELLLVQIRPPETEPDVPDDHDAPLLATGL